MSDLRFGVAILMSIVFFFAIIVCFILIGQSNNVDEETCVKAGLEYLPATRYSDLPYGFVQCYSTDNNSVVQKKLLKVKP